MKYEVIVGNVGIVLTCQNKRKAVKTYRDYVKISKEAIGRAGAEDVFLIADEEEVETFYYLNHIITQQEYKVQRLERQLVEQKAILNGLLNRLEVQDNGI